MTMIITPVSPLPRTLIFDKSTGEKSLFIVRNSVLLFSSTFFSPKTEKWQKKTEAAHTVDVVYPKVREKRKRRINWSMRWKWESRGKNLLGLVERNWTLPISTSGARLRQRLHSKKSFSPFSLSLSSLLLYGKPQNSCYDCWNPQRQIFWLLNSSKTPACTYILSNVLWWNNTFAV